MQTRQTYSPPLSARAAAVLAALLALVLAAGLAPPAAAQDLSDMLVRLNQLEGQVRTLSGQVEELEFENRRLRDQLQRMQEDVEFRFRELGGGAPAGAPSQTTPQRRGDAFDPSADPTAPGAPRPLGTTTPSAPLAAEPSLPPGVSGIIAETPPPAASGGPLDIGAILRGEAEAAAPPASRAGPSIAATGSADPRLDYDSAYAYLLQRQYERAEMGFRQFIQSHPRDALIPDAVFWLGETYAQRGRHREAAEQFLRVTTEHEASAKAPDAMLKLGASLVELGAREQACATFAELLRKYPAADSSVRESVSRERRRAACA